MELSRREQRLARNAALIWDGGNQYRPAEPFFTVPSWWRRFVFTVLTPREWMVYGYVCCHTDPNGVAYPTYVNIRADLNISNKSVIARALSNLVSKGFLLQSSEAPLDNHKHPRNIYQRPAVEYTLWRLITAGYVDGELRPLIPRPTRASAKGAKSHWNGGAIRHGLAALLGEETYNVYSRAPTAEEKGTILAEACLARLDDLRVRYKAEHPEPSIEELVRIMASAEPPTTLDIKDGDSLDDPLDEKIQF